ncbi:MAG: alpha/beta hydrolase [Anaerolineae bacterium]|nr:alpha/beta hydrolase [Anaerolineae bacterium]
MQKCRLSEAIPYRNIVSHTLDFNDERLAYITAGDVTAPPLLCVHGWMGTKADWRLMLPTLSQSYYCVAMDLLGHGDSDKPRDGDYSIQAQANRVLAVADHLGLKRFTLCVHSMGGMIALTIAATLAPERVTRVFNLAGVITKKSLLLKAALWLAQRAEFLVYWGFALARCIAPYRWGRWLLTMFIFYSLRRPEDFGEASMRDIVQPGMETTFWRGVEAIMAMDLPPLLPNITCPVLSIFGKQDLIVPISQGRLADTLIPHHRLFVIQRCGHYIMLEKPRACLEAMALEVGK